METLSDRLIILREGILNSVFGIAEEQVLNSGLSPSKEQVTACQISAELKNAVNAFKTAAIDGTTHRVDYGIVRDSKSYQQFQLKCSPQLRGINSIEFATINDGLAFWVNLYNVLVINAVIEFKIKNSIKEVPFGVTAFFRKAAYNIGGQRFNCDDIEHGILRGNRGHPFIPGPQFVSSDSRRKAVIENVDPRIHFALNCASQSCPPIGVYAPKDIDRQLDIAAHNFIDANVKILNKRMSISPIFKWYLLDFGGHQGVKEFLIKYLPDDERRKWLSERPRANFIYQNYDWTLNT